MERIREVYLQEWDKSCGLIRLKQVVGIMILHGSDFDCMAYIFGLW